MTCSEALKEYRIQFGMLVVLIGALYYQIVIDMVMVWNNDENYSHGFLVPFIALYFLWQRWPDLKSKIVKPSAIGFVIIVIGLFQLFFSWLSVEYFLMRSSLIVVLTGLSLLFLGREIVKCMVLPLGYLVFMVPIPYIIYDMVAFPLKLFVTKVSVFIMKLVGVIVLREGNILMFPTTTLEVADACSGIRSLISLLALAVAYAFFVHTSNFRRWIIIASAIPIAIATNAMRVIVTGILAQWWGEKAAQGFFHEFAGLAVFALAMAMLVAVGAVVKGRDSNSESLAPVSKIPVPSPESLVPNFKSQVPSSWFLVTGLMLIAATLYVTFHQNVAVPTNKPFSQFPAEVISWKMVSDTTFSDPVLSVLKPTDYVMRQYRGADGKDIGLYVGFHNGGKGTGGIHSPKHCLPGSGWYEVSTAIIPVILGGKQENIVRAIYQKGESKELFLYWFQMKDKVLSNEYALKIVEITNSILYGRKDEAFIRISIPFELDEARTIARGDQFIKDFYPVISEFLPK